MTDGEENLVVSRAGPRGGARGRDQPLRRRAGLRPRGRDRKSTRLNSSHSQISYAVFCLKKKKCEFNYHLRILPFSSHFLYYVFAISDLVSILRNSRTGPALHATETIIELLILHILGHTP